MKRRHFLNFYNLLFLVEFKKLTQSFFWNQPYSIVQFKITNFMDFIRIKKKISISVNS